jgi:hypothetical protein
LIVLYACNATESIRNYQKRYDDHANNDVDLDVLEETGEDDVERPQHKQCQTAYDCVRKVRSIMITRQVSHAYTIQCVALCRNTSHPIRGQHIHREVAISDVSLQVSRGGVRHEILPVSKSIDHGMCGRFSVENFAAVTTPRVENKHRVVDLSAGEHVDANGGVQDRL